MGKTLKALSALAATMAALLVAGCGFQPLYGTTSSGADMREVMRGVDVAVIPGRVGQQIRNELIFAATGGGERGPKVYRLEIAIKQAVQHTFANTSGQVQGQVYELSAEYRLIRISDEKVVLKGSTGSRAAYDKVQSVFADVRAQRDAQDRAARTVVEAIKARVAGYLSHNA